MDVSFCLQSRDTTDMFPINMLNENDQYLSERDKAAPFTVQSQLGFRDERFASLKLRSRRSRNRCRRTRRSFDTRGIGQSDPAIRSDKSETPTDRSEARIHGQRGGAARSRGAPRECGDVPGGGDGRDRSSPSSREHGGGPVARRSHVSLPRSAVSALRQEGSRGVSLCASFFSLPPSPLSSRARARATARPAKILLPRARVCTPRRGVAALNRPSIRRRTDPRVRPPSDPATTGTSTHPGCVLSREDNDRPTDRSTKRRKVHARVRV